MTKTGTDSLEGANEGQPQDETPRGALQSIALLARELNSANTLGESFQSAFAALGKLLKADALSAVTESGDADRLRLRARADATDNFRSLSDGEVVRVRHTMLERAARDLAPVIFNNAQSELSSSELLISLVCAEAESILCAPLVIDEKAKGMLVLSASRT